jgi:hypothetical protein
VNNFTTTQAANGYLVEFTTPGSPYRCHEKNTYVFVDVADMCARLPGVLKQREEANAPKQTS